MDKGIWNEVQKWDLAIRMQASKIRSWYLSDEDLYQEGLLCVHQCLSDNPSLREKDEKTQRRYIFRSLHNFYFNLTRKEHDILMLSLEADFGDKKISLLEDVKYSQQRENFERRISVLQALGSRVETPNDYQVLKILLFPPAEAFVVDSRIARGNGKRMGNRGVANFYAVVPQLLGIGRTEFWRSRQRIKALAKKVGVNFDTV